MTPDLNSSIFRARVRYVECDAHGELFLASCATYFSEAAALALLSVEIDLRAISIMGGPLRECAVTVQLNQALGYGDEIEVSSWLEQQQSQEFTLAFAVCRRGEQQLVAEGRMRYVARLSLSGAAGSLPLDLQAKLPLLKRQTAASC